MEGVIEIFHQTRDWESEERLWDPLFNEDTAPPWPHNYKRIAAVASSDLDVAWEKTNHIDSDWTENREVRLLDKNPQRSSMVGDVFVKDGEAFMVMHVGFKPLSELLCSE